jgi:hypothetical protein
MIFFKNNWLIKIEKIIFNLDKPVGYCYVSLMLRRQIPIIIDLNVDMTC